MSQDYRCNSHHSSALVAHNTIPSVSRRDILKQEVARSCERQNERRNEEGNIQLKVAEHECHRRKSRLERRNNRVARGRATRVGIHRRRRLRTLRTREKSIQRSCAFHCLCGRRDLTICIFHAVAVALSINLDDLGCRFTNGYSQGLHDSVVAMKQNNSHTKTDDEGEKWSPAMEDMYDR